jgi:uncharacterized protein YkwD
VRFSSLCLALLLTAAIGLVATAPTAEAAIEPESERRARNLVNRDRVRAGLKELRVCRELRAVARRHSVRMADRNRLYHNPNLTTQVTHHRRVGENVGYNSHVDYVHRAFMRSSGHRANILSRYYTQVGIGVDNRNGRRWVTMVFRQPTSGAPCT